MNRWINEPVNLQQAANVSESMRRWNRANDSMDPWIMNQWITETMKPETKNQRMREAKMHWFQSNGPISASIMYTPWCVSPRGRIFSFSGLAFFLQDAMGVSSITTFVFEWWTHSFHDKLWDFNIAGRFPVIRGFYKFSRNEMKVDVDGFLCACACMQLHKF